MLRDERWFDRPEPCHAGVPHTGVACISNAV